MPRNATSKTAVPKAKKQAQRSCVACRQSATKQQLVRFVRNKDGSLDCDPTGRMSGRGAYVCATSECFDAARRKQSLSKALKCPISNGQYEHLRVGFEAACAQFGTQVQNHHDR
ncbi:MAG: YlxR family protein [Coriobacteriales bacterium]|nr:YlxR family protein [Coriobacteriales bacterium]